MFAFTKLMQAMVASGTVSDPQFYLTTLLLNTSSTNGAQNNTFLDSSTNNFTITRNGNTTQGTFTPFSQTGWSNYTASGYLTTAANAGFALSGDFTVEAWVYSGDSSLDGTTRRRIFHTGGGDIANALQLVLGTSGGNSAVISVLSNSFLIDGTINVVTNSWVHVAVTRSGTSLRLFVNGVQSGSTATTSQNFNSGTSNTVYIGANSSGAGLWQGYISNLRVLVGTAAYTSGFTPPTASFATGTTNQQLLVCASNGFSDINTATTAKVITVNSTPSVQAFSPFAPTAAYSTSAVGGSGYFDGSGDYLTLGGVAGLAIGTNDFEISLWAYWNSVGTQVLYEGRPGSNGAYPAILTNSSVLYYFVNTAYAITGPTVVANQWYYITVSRVSGTTKMFVNGSQVGSNYTDSTNYGTGSTAPWIGAGYAPGDYMNGYISNVRVVIGSGVTSQTVPTAPLTAITNTKLLLSCTNTGIYDSASKNVLETVGNAQVSTTQAKWGTTSMYFDGNGDWLLIPNNQMLNLNADFTIDFWIYLNSTTGEQCIFHNHNSDNNGILVSVNGGGAGKIRFGAGNGSSFYVLIDSSTAISVSTWTYVACTRSGSTWTIYINGSSAGTATSSSNPTFSTSDLIQIGRFTSGTPNALNAYIDDFRITKYARTITASPTAAFPLQQVTYVF